MYSKRLNKGVGWFVADPSGYFVGYAADEASADAFVLALNNLIRG